MNSIHNNGENDKTLHDDLDRLSNAYGQLEQPEPPDLIDQAILNSAHRAVEKKPHWMKFSWLQGLTTAAVFVLAFSLILKQHDSAPVDVTGDDETAGSQLRELRTDDSVFRAKMKSDRRQEALQNMAATAPADEPQPSMLKKQQTSYTSGRLVEETMSIQKDDDKAELSQESPVEDEMDSGQQSRREDLGHAYPSPATAGESLLKEAENQSATAQQLLAIIRLKETGDDTWITELEKFRQAHPDYPLPEELKPESLKQ